MPHNTLATKRKVSKTSPPCIICTYGGVSRERRKGKKGRGGEGGEGRDVPAFFSASESVFQSFSWSSSSCWCTAVCSGELSDAHCASTLESGIALAADTVVVEAAEEAAAWGGCAAVVARPRRTIRSAAEACIGGDDDESRVVLQRRKGKKHGKWSGANRGAHFTSA